MGIVEPTAVSTIPHS